MALLAGRPGDGAFPFHGLHPAAGVPRGDPSSLCSELDEGPGNGFPASHDDEETPWGTEPEA